MSNLEQLIQALHCTGEEGCWKAAKALRERGEPGGQLSAETLISTLLHDTTPLRKAAAEILRAWREYVPIEPLFLAMQDEHPQVRASVKWALADVGKCAPQERLLPHLADMDSEVRTAVLDALGTRAPVTSVLEALSASDEMLREVAIWLIGQLKERVPVEPLISLLHTDDACLRAAAAQALGALGERMPLEPLIEALQDGDADVRLQAVRALAHTSERMPVMVLRALLDESTPTIRQAATKALARIGDPTALAIIVESLHADHEWARETALCFLLESTGTETSELARHLPMEVWLDLLKDTWWPVGVLAARIIATLGEEAPLAALLAFVSHPLPETRQAALHTLALLDEHMPLSQSIPLEPVLAALEAEEVETRRRAAEVLDIFGPLVPIDRVLPYIEEEDTRIARLVAKRGRQEGIDALVASLRTRDHARHAAHALGELGEHAPAEPLIAALHTGDPTVRQTVAEALYKTHPELLPPLVAELVETLCYGHVGPLLEPLPHVLLTRALAGLQSPQPALLAWLDQALNAPHWEVRMWAVLGSGWMLPNIPREMSEKLPSLVNDAESASVRKAALHMLR